MTYSLISNILLRLFCLDKKVSVHELIHIHKDGSSMKLSISLTCLLSEEIYIIICYEYNSQNDLIYDLARIHMTYVGNQRD